MNFKINSAIFEKFPSLNIGLVVVKGIENTGENDEIMSMVKNESEKIRAKFNTETLGENPKIEAWREAYRAFGAKPKKHKSSVENLYRMVLEGIELRHINKIVDLYNYISLKFMVPVGGDDIDKIDGDIELTFAKGDEPFTQLNTEEVTSPKEGEMIYRDNKEVLCRRWNYRECDKSKMTKDTKNVALVIEGLAPVTQEEVESISREFAELAEKHCGGETEAYILNKDKRELSL